MRAWGVGPDESAKRAGAPTRPRPYGGYCRLSEDSLRKIVQLKHKHEDRSEEKAKEMEALRDAILYPDLPTNGDVGQDSAKRAEWVRRQVRDLLNEPVAKHGTNQFGKNKGVDIINSLTEGGTSESYAISRLKRDRRALAEKVISGEMSAKTYMTMQ
jgi:hypothetical protein